MSDIIGPYKPDMPLVHRLRGVPRSITQIQTSYVRIDYIRESFTIPNNYVSHYILISIARRHRPIRRVH